MSILNDLNRKWWILFTMTCAISMIFLDVTILPVSLPTIQRDLNFTDLGLQWIVNSYTLSLTIFVLAAGRFGDRFGHRRIFFGGLFVFSLGSILSAMSYYEWWFISARFLQGIGGAMLIPTAAAILFPAFPPQQRGKAIGLYVSIGSIFLSLGPFIGGLFSEYLNWRYIFWVNIPIAVIGGCLALWCVPKSPTQEKKFDFLGFFTFSLGISLIVIALMQVRSWGWGSLWTLSFLFVGVVMLITLLILDRKVSDPYLDVSLFSNPTFTGCILSIIVTQFVLMTGVYWMIYLQNALEFTPAGAGLVNLASNIPVFFAAPFGGHLLDKYGPRLPILSGFVIMIASLFWFVLNIGNPSIFIILSAFIPFGCGIPLILTPSFTTALAEVSPDKRGLASGTSTMLRQFGGTIGLAVMTSVLLTTQFQEFSGDLKRNILTKNISPKEFRGILSKTKSSIDNLNKLPKQEQQFVEQSARNAFLKGFWQLNSLAIVVSVLGLGAAFVLIRKKSRPEIEM